MQQHMQQAEGGVVSGSGHALERTSDQVRIWNSDVQEFLGPVIITAQDMHAHDQPWIYT